MPSLTFAELGVSQAAVRALNQRDVTAPFAIQSLVIPDVLAGRDVLAKSPTGSGKTLAFGVPIADRIEATDPRPSALILAPTRELATQIVEAIRDVAHARALSITAVYGGAGIEKQARQAPKSHILVATPGRLEDLIQRGAVRLDRVRLLVLDEADRMLDMGFRPVVERIVKQTRRDRQTLLFSATLDGEVGRLAAAYTHDPRTHEHVPAPEALGKVAHRFVRLAHDDKLDALVRELRDDARGRTLVFVRTKRGADRLVKRLDRHNLHALAMHGDKSQNQRERALGRFDRGDIDTLVATDVAARGIDVDDITHVVNFDAPEDREGYVHRVGRTARAGRTGTGVTFVMDDQARDMGKIAAELELHHEFTSAGFATPTVPTRANGAGRSGGPGRSAGQRRRRSGPRTHARG
ncbi:MAG TPA: DEAD/DEAH box helicase [Solirubrobacteraceae bacterium]|nr:DEAD/DEAH box helicase [Solirubrobacteraceae bacterium]